jgi:hypothetical protein
VSAGHVSDGENAADIALTGQYDTADCHIAADQRAARKTDCLVFIRGRI